MPFSTDRVTEQIFHGCIPAKLKPVLLWLALHIEDVNDDLPRQHRREKNSLPAILQTSSYSSFITQIFTEKNRQTYVFKAEAELCPNHKK